MLVEGVDASRAAVFILEEHVIGIGVEISFNVDRNARYEDIDVTTRDIVVVTGKFTVDGIIYAAQSTILLRRRERSS